MVRPFFPLMPSPWGEGVRLGGRVRGEPRALFSGNPPELPISSHSATVERERPAFAGTRLWHRLFSFGWAANERSRPIQWPGEAENNRSPPRTFLGRVAVETSPQAGGDCAANARPVARAVSRLASTRAPASQSHACPLTWPAPATLSPGERVTVSRGISILESRVAGSLYPTASFWKVPEEPTAYKSCRGYRAIFLLTNHYL